MSLFKKITGHSWAGARRSVIAASNYVGAAAAGVGLSFIPGVGVGAGLAAAGAIISANTAYEAADDARKQEKATKKAEAEAKKAAEGGAIADVAEAGATEDTAGNNAYKKKQAALAGSAGGRSGTLGIKSNLGGGGSLG